MASLAVFASGKGSNFVALAERLRGTSRHRLAILVCDVAGAPVLDRARELAVPARCISYRGRSRAEAEADMLEALREHRVDAVALAGFMRLLTPFFLSRFPGPVLNLHPSLLPKYPGTHGIEESFRSADRELGISVIRVDEGVDTGPVVLQRSFTRTGTESLEEIERLIHDLEHEWFPVAVLRALDGLDGGAA
ncbi:MAG: phosphoribosylglycinamide formyltransferase [Spirochaetes bacterium]|nr:phosphoribosylglycinamide formyltransferase [Spirochaetota bacterium]